MVVPLNNEGNREDRRLDWKVLLLLDTEFVLSLTERSSKWAVPLGRSVRRKLTIFVMLALLTVISLS